MQIYAGYQSFWLDLNWGIKLDIKQVHNYAKWIRISPICFVVSYQVNSERSRVRISLSRLESSLNPANKSGNIRNLSSTPTCNETVIFTFLTFIFNKSLSGVTSYNFVKTKSERKAAVNTTIYSMPLTVHPSVYQYVCQSHFWSFTTTVFMGRFVWNLAWHIHAPVLAYIYGEKL